MKITKKIIAEADRIILISSLDQIDLIFSEMETLKRFIKLHLQLDGFYSFTLRISEKESQKILVIDQRESSAEDQKEIREKLKGAKYEKLISNLKEWNKKKALEFISQN